MVFETHRKTLIQHCERSIVEAFGQTVLQDRSALIEQNCGKGQKLNTTFWLIFKQCAQENILGSIKAYKGHFTSLS